MVKVGQITGVSTELGELGELNKINKLGEFNKLSNLSYTRFKLRNFDGLALDKELDQQC
ncbi:hypothetical protein [Paenibacillus paridis]|uniref:hypothetical protein n=1 Tax=Paenibacillus paridis TaxID=2583376 RepID=UPI0013916298|nr:hypothetical protein [Paenibacillus paridis]